MSDQSGSSSGPSTDAHNVPVIDPTRNVLDLVAAAITRQDDLRDQQAKHAEQIALIRDDHTKELRFAETERINSIRAVDVSAVAAAAQVATTQANTLAAQVATSAETLRTQVSAAATAATVALAAALEPIQKDIADLRRVQYEAVGGKTQADDSGVSSRAWTSIVVAICALTATVLLGATGIVLTILLRR